MIPRDRPDFCVYWTESDQGFQIWHTALQSTEMIGIDNELNLWCLSILCNQSRSEDRVFLKVTLEDDFLVKEACSLYYSKGGSVRRGFKTPSLRYR